MFKLFAPALGLIALYAPTPTFATSDTTDISAARRGGGPAQMSARPAMRGNVGRVNVNRANVGRVNINRANVGRVHVNRGNVGRVNVNRGNIGRVNVNRGVAIRGGQGVAVGRVGRVGVAGPGRLGVGPGRVVVGGARLGGVSTVALRGNRIATVYTGPRRLWWGGRWRAFVPLTALGVVAIGAAYYYPTSYLAVGRPYCEGVAPNGCHLNWQMVGFDDGDGAWQCVQYCPRPGAMPPPKAVALTAPPAMAQGQGKCEIAIYSEPKFASAAVPTSDDQPKLSESGWQNQIASVEVKAGTWEMFTEEQYTGNAMRLAPGSYPELEPDWMKKINSFMCVEPSN